MEKLPGIYAKIRKDPTLCVCINFGVVLGSLLGLSDLPFDSAMAIGAVGSASITLLITVFLPRSK